MKERGRESERREGGRVKGGKEGERKEGGRGKGGRVEGGWDGKTQCVDWGIG